MGIYLVIYRNKNFEYKYRILQYHPPYKVGDRTSMGWDVIDIQYYFENQFYTYKEYQPLKTKELEKFDKRLEKENKKRRIRTKIKRDLKFELKKIIDKYLE